MAERFGRRVGFHAFGRVDADEPHAFAAVEQQRVAVDDALDVHEGRRGGVGLRRTRAVRRSVRGGWSSRQYRAAIRTISSTTVATADRGRRR